MTMIKPGLIAAGILILLCILVNPCTAVQPDWVYTDSDAVIEDLVVAPDGSAVIAGAGRVVLLSKNGTVLAREPFGDIVVQSGDGSSIVTVYPLSGSSTLYRFMKKTDPDGTPTLQKLWEVATPDKITSVAVSENGDRIAISTGGVSGVQVYDGKSGNRIGYSNEYSSLISIAGDGNTVAGISTANGLKLYNSSIEFLNNTSGYFINNGTINNASSYFINNPVGNFIKKYDIPLHGQPNTFLINNQGTVVIFNTGSHIIAFNISEGAEEWRTKSSTTVKMLAMIPSGNYVVAGTENGTIDYYDANGNLKWTYHSDNGTGSGHAIQAVAMTRSGLKIIAGSADGKIFLLNSDGSLLWKYDTEHDKISKVAIAADGSLAVAAGEFTIYAFTSLGKQSVPRVTAAPTQRSVVTTSPTIPMTQYTIIHRTTPSPFEDVICLIALMIAGLIIFRKDH